MSAYIILADYEHPTDVSPFLVVDLASVEGDWKSVQVQEARHFERPFVCVYSVVFLQFAASLLNALLRATSVNDGSHWSLNSYTLDRSAI